MIDVYDELMMCSYPLLSVVKVRLMSFILSYLQYLQELDKKKQRLKNST